MSLKERLNAAEKDALFYDARYRQMIEDHLLYLIHHEKTEWFDLDPSIVAQSKGDFYGLLTKVKIPGRYHWIYLRCNGYVSSSEFNGDTFKILVPPEDVIQKLTTTFRAHSMQ